jgi:hypothetical protein
VKRAKRAVAEADNGHVFRAELLGSALLVAAAMKGGEERLFTDAPIDDVDDTRAAQERPIDEKNMSGCFKTHPLMRDMNPDGDQSRKRAEL